MRLWEESRERIEEGGIPVAAERRLESLGSEGSLFTSGLSVREFSLLNRMGYSPAGQVMGASVVRPGLQQPIEGLALLVRQHCGHGVMGDALGAAPRPVQGKLDHRRARRQDPAPTQLVECQHGQPPGARATP